MKFKILRQSRIPACAGRPAWAGRRLWRKDSKFKIILILILIVFSNVFSYGETQRERLEKVLPGSPRIDSFKFIEEIGFYEVVADGRLFYLSRDLRFLFIGNVIDLRTLKNLTSDRIKEMRRVDFSSLPRADAIKISDGKRAIAVFTDPECPYCKKLHAELGKLKDVSVYIYLFPISSGGRNKAIQVWCSEDRVRALDSAFNGGRLKASLCEGHPIDRNLSLGQRLFITGTPMIITDRGEFINGYVRAEVIEKALAR